MLWLNVALPQGSTRAACSASQQGFPAGQEGSCPTSCCITAVPCRMLVGLRCTLICWLRCQHILRCAAAAAKPHAACGCQVEDVLHMLWRLSCTHRGMVFASHHSGCALSM